MTVEKINNHLCWEEVKLAKILCNDLKGISSEEFITRMKAFETYVLNLGRDDIRVYSDVTKTIFNIKSMHELKKIAFSTKDIISKYAVVGVDGVKRVLFNGVKPVATKDLKAFDSVEEAKEWLIE